MYVFVIGVCYCLDVLKTRLQDYESSARNRVSESAPNFTVSRAHLHDSANQVIVTCFLCAVFHIILFGFLHPPCELTFSADLYSLFHINFYLVYRRETCPP